MEIVCLDLEGVLVPEIWIAFAEKTGIEALKRTTRDEPDYDALMQYRLDLLRENNLKMSDIQDVISQMAPLEGARDFLGQLREDFQVVILSDTFYEFAKPLMRQLDLPTLFCHRLLVDETDAVVGYQLRLADHKRKAVEAFAQLNFYTIAAGDSYNDTSMLSRADVGVLFNAPENVRTAFPQFRTTTEYDGLMALIKEGSPRFG
ncbi:bifunctional phosphoserine phosphatase/homoserine phosphotransferase ThrH [Terasakiella pusilla]|uniref:bifunctional phosphoserine phosphatase/homoserine phosphotransferase ThrH n=1 Tax=Terasakiella pusilla TaxID=64973 RepID=UPI00048EF1F7|nr:bifunctional phosphoserine phosphatase/homoserine phosphotransferase ThrH [Terasakiella pusilla]